MKALILDPVGTRRRASSLARGGVTAGAASPLGGVTAGAASPLGGVTAGAASPLGDVTAGAAERLFLHGLLFIECDY